MNTLLRIDRDGHEVSALQGVPALATVDGAAGVLSFYRPTGLAPGTCLRARLRG